MKQETEIRFKINKEMSIKIYETFLNWIYKEQKDIYYKGNFKGVLRTRESENKKELCCKMDNNIGSWDEYETEIDCDLDMLNKIFKNIGLTEKVRINKTRLSTKTFRKDKEIEINLDLIEGLGLFCEMEIDGDYRNVIIELAKELGIKEEDITTKGYVQLIKESRKK